MGRIWSALLGVTFFLGLTFIPAVAAEDKADADPKSKYEKMKPEEKAKLVAEEKARLGNQNARVRKDAVQTLGDLGDVSAVPELLAKVGNDPDKFVLARLYSTLGKLPTAEGLKYLLNAYTGADDKTKTTIKSALEKFQTKEYTAAWIGIINNSEAAINLRLIALNNLRMIKDDDAKKTLCAAVEDASPSVQEQAIKHCGSLKLTEAAPKMATAFDKALPPVKLQILKNVPKLSEEIALTIVPKALADSEETIRAEGLALATELKAQNCADKVLELFGDKNKQVRQKAAVALGVFKYAKAVDELKAALDRDSEDIAVKSAAVMALAEIGDKNTFDVISNAAQKNVPEDHPEDGALKIAALRALGKLRDPRAVPVLLDQTSYYGGRADEARQAAVLSLGDLADRQAESRLIELAGDRITAKRNDLAIAAIKSLGKIATTDAVDALLEASRDPELEYKVPALLSLGQTKSYKCVDELVDCLNAKQKEVQIAAIKSLKNITGDDMGFDLEKPLMLRQKAVENWRKWWDAEIDKQLQLAVSPDENIRIAAWTKLADMGPEKSLDAALKALTSSNKQERVLAINALGQIGSSKAIVPMSRLLAEKDPEICLAIIHAMRQIRDASCRSQLADMLQLGTTLNNKEILIATAKAYALFPPRDPKEANDITSLTTNKDADVRLIAVETLVKQRMPENVTYMKDLFDDPDLRVRRAVITGSITIGMDLIKNLTQIELLGKYAKALRDPELTVRSAAIDALERIYKNNQGYNPSADLTDRNQFADKWDAFIAGEFQKFETLKAEQKRMEDEKKKKPEGVKEEPKNAPEDKAQDKPQDKPEVKPDSKERGL